MKKETIKERSHAAINALLEGITQEQLSEVSSTEGMVASALIRANQSRKEAEELLSLDNPIELTSGNEALPPEVEDPREDEFYGIRETLKSGLILSTLMPVLPVWNF